LKRNVERIFLVGYRGAGKSTVARRLGERLGWDWLDADDFLEKKHGCSIREIFEAEGEAGFRDKESAALAELCGRQRLVIATGGGVVLREANRELLRRNSAVIWLQTDAATILARLRADPASAERRPPLTEHDPLEEIETLLAAREPFYRQCADLTVDAGRGSPEDVVVRIVNELEDASAKRR
jgi:shikimate kinase